eukprot:TRINITY_DN2403_c0_g3_i1.p1 TRINITY_DN2403_c0_g3~~TRINITY_DN2403_c0_g3_i1.p1  ORF type:complete len:342 (+),score=59.78 TRINITY_DN2403_c0_g3_i1:68-1093(+)
MKRVVSRPLLVVCGSVLYCLIQLTMSSTTYGLPGGKHHLVIGKGGSTIKQLQADFGVNITLPRLSESLIIEGEEEGCEKCRQHLEELLNFELQPGELTVIEMDVPKHKYGALIGPRGSNLRNVESESKADVEVPSRMAPEGSKVRIQGSDACCTKAVSLIEELIQISVSVEKKGKDPSILKEEHKADLTEPVNRALFFPDHEEADGMRTFEVFLQYLRSVEKSLDVCIFALTNNDIAETILNLHRKGVPVRVICDNDQAESQGADICRLRQAGINVREDKTEFHMHHKFAILDGSVLLNGSFNWTLQAVTSNNENVVITSDAELIQQFQACYEKMWAEFDE